MSKKTKGAPIVVTRGQLRRSLVLLAGLITVAAMLLAGLTIPMVGMAAVTTQAGAEAFNEMPAEFDVSPPSQQSVLLSSDGKKIASFYAENRIIVGSKDISQNVKNAAVAIEDHRFFEHQGVDSEGMVRAVINNLLGSDRQGASTITQQYVKNTLIELGLQAGDDSQVNAASAPTLDRKIREAKYALTIEKNLSKDEILTGYLNIAPYGTSVYGVEAASQRYYSKPAKDLSVAQAALLAGITKSPAAYDPTVDPQAAQVRRDQVLYAMLNYGYIDHKQYEEAKAINVEDMLKVSNAAQGCEAAGSAAYFCEFVVQEIMNNPVFGDTLQERRNLLLRGGLTIKSTLNMADQQAAQEAVEKHVPTNDPSGVSTAVSSIEPGTGRVTVLAQNSHFGIATKDDPGATQVSYGVDKAHGGGAGYQPGSSFKTMTLAAWYQAKRSGYEIVGGRTSFNANEFYSSCPKEVKTGDYKFSNAPGLPTSAGTVIQGTKQSLNTTYVSMASKLDLCSIKRMAQTVNAVPGDGSNPEWYPSMVIGVTSVPPLNMANAFATWLADGKYCTPIAIDSITNSTGEQLAIPSANCVQKVDKTVSQQVSYTLNLTYNSYGSTAALGRPAATKTGTTDNNADVWMVGGTPNLVTAVWVGHATGLAPMENITIGGRYFGAVYSDSLPSWIWRDYMLKAVNDLPVKTIPAVSLGQENAGYKPATTGTNGIGRTTNNSGTQNNGRSQ
ncbi:MAG: transglycosylase domain-containing protein [Varibaculum sp.]|nr:transglycosylase domain-containing protein [Varibaculum sp.]